MCSSIDSFSMMERKARPSFMLTRTLAREKAVGNGEQGREKRRLIPFERRNITL